MNSGYQMRETSEQTVNMVHHKCPVSLL